MLKFFIILALITIVVLYALSRVSKAVRKAFSVFSPDSGNLDKEKAKEEGGEVIYNKGEVTVLKGEAKERNTNKKGQA